MVEGEEQTLEKMGVMSHDEKYQGAEVVATTILWLEQREKATYW